MSVRWVHAASGVALVSALAAGSAPAQVEIFGGPTYNTYSIDWEALALGLEHLPFNSGWGAQGGVQYWLNESVALGAQIDSFTGSSSHQGDYFRASMREHGVGYLARIAGHVTVGDRYDLRLFTALGTYQVVAQVEIEEEDVFYLDDATLASSADVIVRFAPKAKLGGLVGASLGVPLSSHVTLGGTFGYRFMPELSEATITVSEPAYDDEEQVEVDDLKGWKMSGLTVGLELRYAF